MLIMGRTRYLKGFYDDFIGTEEYDTEIFDKVIQLRGLDNWKDIDELMKHEFMFKWDKYKESHKDSV